MCCLSVIPLSHASLAAWIGASGRLFPSETWIGNFMHNPLLTVAELRGMPGMHRHTLRNLYV